MAVISITVTESTTQVLSGIPRSVIISTNIPSTIFYTLDGTDPTVASDIYVSTLYLPTDLPAVELKIFATNGVDSSPIVTNTYQTDMLQNARLPHASTDVQAGENIPDLYPYGINPIQPMGTYLNPGDAGTTVDNPSLSQIASGYDGDGYETGFTNEPYNLEHYKIIYATRNAEGEGGPYVGNLPANVVVEQKEPIPEETEQFTNLFDPRAFVIFQDFSKENPEDPPQINREFFTLENFETARDGANLFTSGLDSPPVMGSFVRSFYNPRDNTITYYYRDNHANRWIISKTPYNPSGAGFDNNLATMALSKEKGAGFVFQWVPYTRRVLF